MESNYDENLSENSFLRILDHDHADTFARAVEQQWIICVPRQGSFKNDLSINKENISRHILQPDKDKTDGYSFVTLAGGHVTLKNRLLTLNYDHENLTSRLLFEETFYTNNHAKYTVW